MNQVFTLAHQSMDYSCIAVVGSSPTGMPAVIISVTLRSEKVGTIRFSTTPIFIATNPRFSEGQLLRIAIKSFSTDNWLAKLVARNAPEDILQAPLQ